MEKENRRSSPNRDSSLSSRRLPAPRPKSGRKPLRAQGLRQGPDTLPALPRLLPRVHRAQGNSPGRCRLWGGVLLGLLGSSLGVSPTGLIPYFWVVAAVAFVLVVILVYLRFLFHLPEKALLLFLGAGGFLVAGAIGVEMAEAGLDYYILQIGQRQGTSTTCSAGTNIKTTSVQPSWA